MTKEALSFIQWSIPLLPRYLDREVDKMRIETSFIKKGEAITVVSMRNAIFSNHTPLKVRLDYDYPLQSLISVENGLWMTNSLQEMYQMKAPIESCKSPTLIGGLGLGVFSVLHAAYHATGNTTIERDPRVIKLVRPKHAVKQPAKKWVDRSTIVQADLLEFIKELKPGQKQFHSAFFDTWQQTGQDAWVRHVVPLRRLCRGKIRRTRVHCWCENEMKGQFTFGNQLAQWLFLPVESATYWEPQWVISNRGQELGLPKLTPTQIRKREMDMSDLITDELLLVIKRFLNTCGSDKWEAEFGELWDSYQKGTVQ